MSLRHFPSLPLLSRLFWYGTCVNLLMPGVREDIAVRHKRARQLHGALQKKAQLNVPDP